jgi:hypothetical protein
LSGTGGDDFKQRLASEKEFPKTYKDAY